MEYLVGDVTKKTWFQTGGYKSTFTYNADTHLLLETTTHKFKRIPSATDFYSADYKEYSYLDYRKATEGDNCTSATETSSSTFIFNQDMAVMCFVLDGNNYTFQSEYNDSYTVSGVTYSALRKTVQSYTIGEDVIEFSENKDDTTATDGAETSAKHYRTADKFEVYACYEFGFTDTEATFSDIWKKDSIANFIYNRTAHSYYEYEGATPPTAPTVVATTGTASSGTLTASPLNYYEINNTLGTTTYTNFINYGDCIAYYSSNISRNLE